jgi:chaperonin GroES
MNLKPLFNNVIVEREESEKQTAGGILLPEQAQKKPGKGRIVGAGPGKALDNGETRPMSVKKGDFVLFSTYTGTEIEMSGKTLLVMSEDNILSVIETN